MRNATLSAAALLVLAAGCSKSAQVRASLTDAPIDNVTVFKVTVSEVRFHDQGDDLENDGEHNDAQSADGGATATDGHQDATDDGSRGKGWVVLCSGAQVFDLMQLRPSPTGQKVYASLCGGNAVNVPTGKVDAFWLDVTHVHIEFSNGHAPIDLDLPHGEDSGLKIELEDDLNQNSQADLQIDFDAAGSLLEDSSGNYTVKPRLLQVHN